MQHAETCKFVKVFDIRGVEVVEGVVLNEQHLDALANWLCRRLNNCRDDGELAEKQKERNGGYCNHCRNDAGMMLLDCPYIDMTRTPEPESLAQAQAEAT